MKNLVTHLILTAGVLMTSGWIAGDAQAQFGRNGNCRNGICRNGVCPQQTPGLGIGVQPVAMAMGGQTVQPLMIMQITPNTPGADAGLLPGDILMNVNGVAMPTIPQMQQIQAMSLNSGGLMQLTVMNNRTRQMRRVSVPLR